MKIAVITLHNVRNYGSVLQTYATQKILESFGFQVEFIDYLRKGDVAQKRWGDYFSNHSLKGLIKGLYQALYYEPKQDRKAKKVFDYFLKENIHLSDKKYFSIEELRQDAPKADIYCTGSDQMWNSKWNQGIEKAFFLDFVKSAPKIAFSTSIGMTEFPEDEEKETVKLIKQYDFLSMREESAVKLLNKFGIESTAVLDPTLMCDGAFWREFCKKESEQYADKKYILVYKLHTDHANYVDFNCYVRQLTQKTGLPVKVLSYGVPVKKIFDEYVFMPTIHEFVALFVNAEHIVTDSFHATSFAINLEKQISVIYPVKFSTRLENILMICDMLNRVVKDNDFANLPEPSNYTLITKIMDEQRQQALTAIKDGIDRCVDRL